MTDIRIEKQGEKMALIISGSLTIEFAGEFRDALTESLKNTNYLIVDLDKVTDADLSCLQLLCSAHRTFTDANKSIELIAATDVVKQAASDAAYHRNFGCMPETEKTCLWKGI